MIWALTKEFLKLELCLYLRYLAIETVLGFVFAFCSIQVFPCLEPSYCLQKSRTKQTNLQEEEDDDIGLAKYLPKSLLLPINTFAGIIR